MTTQIRRTSKLNTLVTKLHEYLAYLSDEESSTPSPDDSNGKKKNDVTDLFITDSPNEQPCSSTDSGKHSAHSKRKPSVTTKNTGFNESATFRKCDESFMNESIHGSESNVDLNSLPKGTVVVQPEAVGNEDDFRGPEFRCKGTTKLKSDVLRKRGEHFQIVSCTTCGQQVNHFQRDSLYQHPVLKVLMCKSCFKYYMSDDISKDADGMDEQCRWCAEGGNLICCDFCSNAFCKKCILRNLGRKELSAILDEENKWYCYVCSPEPILDLVSACHNVLQTMGQLWSQQRKRGKPENEKATGDDGTYKHFQKNKPTFHEKGFSVDSHGCRPTAVASRDLMVPKELAKKTKNLVEATSALNNMFLKLLQQSTENQTTIAVKLSQLKAFKGVLAALKNVHSALEEALEQEFLESVLQSGEETVHDITNDETPNASCRQSTSKYSHNHAEKESKIYHLMKLADEVSMENIREGAVAENDRLEKSSQSQIQKGGGEMKVKETTEGTSSNITGLKPPTVPCKMSLGVAAVSPSLPEKQQEVPKTSEHALGTAQKGSYNCRTFLQLNPSPHRVTKKLVVKLTPVQLQKSFESSHFKKDRENKNEGSHEGVDSTEGPSMEHVLPMENEQDSRRLPKVKITPLRRQVDNKTSLTCAQANSDSDVDGDTQTKVQDEYNMANGKKKGRMVPTVLLQTLTSEVESGAEDGLQIVKRKCLFGLNRNSLQPPEKASLKRKRKVSLCDSEHSEFTTTKNTVKKRRPKSDYTSSNESDLQTGTGNPGKRPVLKNNRKMNYTGNDLGAQEKVFLKAMKTRRPTVNSKMCQLKVKHSTEDCECSSFDNHDDEERMCTIEDPVGSADQNMKPITKRTNVLETGIFHQVSVDIDGDDPENHDLRKVDTPTVTHLKCGSRAKQRITKHSSKTGTACTVKTRSQTPPQKK
ncbi:transcriptional regulator ATRX-like isoform X2 [Brienomyrus brachyistius]|uniref:transcriptional regulator ATRX-like isoform X2 n=1 Tax=Brienomyrus brachyistius TaxID=42636 RepID=UPI0020B22D46|nr:transcriptional regulator ATRX-like isoform X2 [Brienomyrus brachyistius]